MKTNSKQELLPTGVREPSLALALNSARAQHGRAPLSVSAQTAGAA